MSAVAESSKSRTAGKHWPLPEGAIEASSPSTGVDENELKPLAIDIPTFCKITSLGRTAAFGLIRDGRLEVRRINRRTLILMKSVEALLGIGGERD